MLGTLAGDIIGSVHEHAGTKHTDFTLFSPWSRLPMTRCSLLLRQLRC
jgi:hypothetical protein